MTSSQQTWEIEKGQYTWFSREKRGEATLRDRDQIPEKKAHNYEKSTWWKQRTLRSGSIHSTREMRWGLGPFAAGPAPGQMSSPATDTKKLEGLKVTACMCSWDRLWTKDTKRPKTQLPLPRCQEQRQGPAHTPLHTIAQKGWADHPGHLSGPTPGPATALSFKEPARMPPQEASGAPITCSPSVHCSMSPNKALPEFLTWPFINSYWWRWPSTWVVTKGAGWPQRTMKRGLLSSDKTWWIPRKKGKASNTEKTHTLLRTRQSKQTNSVQR